MADRFFLDTRDPNINAKLAKLMDFVNGEDPLVCALISTAYIDKCLLGILECLFIAGGETRKTLLQPDHGLLGSLQNRANLVYLLGHIDKPLLANIGNICTIRNLFAHSHEPLTFNSPDIVKWCNQLKVPVPLGAVTDIAEAGQDPPDPYRSQGKFTTTVTHVIVQLIARGIALSGGKGTVPKG